MKKNLSFFITCLLAVSLMGCGSSKIDKKLVGYWVDLDERDGIVLYEDGTWYEDESDQGTFYCEDNRLILQEDGQDIM